MRLKTCRQLRVFIDVDLDDLQPALALASDRGEHRSHRPAGSTPRSPEVHQNGNGRVFHLSAESSFIRLDGSPRKQPMLAATTARFVLQPNDRDPIHRTAIGTRHLDTVHQQPLL